MSPVSLRRSCLKDDSFSSMTSLVGDAEQLEELSRGPPKLNGGRDVSLCSARPFLLHRVFLLVRLACVTAREGDPEEPCRPLPVLRTLR